jgi:hypothetical protein
LTGAPAIDTLPAMETFGIPGAPDDELSRSPAAAVVGRLAAASGLLLSHFEHRVHLPLPLSWTASGQEAEPASWQRGVLPEGKYEHFRHDNAVGSFHPGHRAKWTAHELCHRLVGFAWHPGASTLFHALSARLAEVLPVALWYFFDEAGLRRCDDHAGQGPLFGAFCAACEEAARRGPVPGDERRLVEGRAFVEREIVAVRRSRQLGRPVPHRWATLDLASDGTAYGVAHAPRLDTPEFAEFCERFHAPWGMWHRTLDAMEERVVALTDALCGGALPAPLSGTRDRWIAQDLGWRLIQVRAETEGEATEELTRLVERLATDPGAGTFAAVEQGYRALFEDWILPEPDDVFAVGYGPWRSARQVREGVESVCPAALKLLRDDGLVDEFVKNDAYLRQPLGRRFAAFLAVRAPGPAAQVAALEAVLAQPPLPDPTAGLGVEGARDGRRRWAAGLELLRADVDVLALVEALNNGRTPRPKRRPVNLVVGRAHDGEVVLAEVSDAAAEALAAGAEPALPGDEVESRESLGVVLPVAWEA